jgi:hypothetical protein
VRPEQARSARRRTWPHSGLILESASRKPATDRAPRASRAQFTITRDVIIAAAKFVGRLLQ